MRSARPRLPKGYYDQPRHLMDAVIAAPGLSAPQIRVVLAVMRLTWGHYPERNRAGALIARDTIAEKVGLHRRTIDNVMPELIREGVIVVVTPSEGSRPAVIRLNTNPAKWGRFTPVACTDFGVLEDEYARTSGYNGVAPRSSCSHHARTSVPRVHEDEGTTASPSPSSSNPSPSSPSTPSAPRDAEGRVTEGAQIDPHDVRRVGDVIKGMSVPLAAAAQRSQDNLAKESW